ncbi:MAG: hypothetical protein Q9165_005289 [Trypethelium subeluteriae]
MKTNDTESQTKVLGTNPQTTLDKLSSTAFSSPTTPLDPGEALKLYSPGAKPQPLPQPDHPTPPHGRMPKHIIHCVRPNIPSQRSMPIPCRRHREDGYMAAGSAQHVSLKTMITAVKAMDRMDVSEEDANYAFASASRRYPLVGTTPKQMVAPEHHRRKARQIATQERRSKEASRHSPAEFQDGMAEDSGEMGVLHAGPKGPRGLPKQPLSRNECSGVESDLASLKATETIDFPVALFDDIDWPLELEFDRPLAWLAPFLHCLAESAISECSRIRPRLSSAFRTLSVAEAGPERKLKAMRPLLRIAAQLLVSMYVVACVWRLLMVVRDIIGILFGPLIWTWKGMKTVAGF